MPAARAPGCKPPLRSCAVVRIEHCTAAGCQHDAVALHQLGDHRLLAFAKAVLALDLEDGGHAHARARFDLMVGIVKGSAGQTGKVTTHSRLARAHQANKYVVACRHGAAL